MAEFIGYIIDCLVDLFNLFFEIPVDEFMGQTITFGALIMLGVGLAAVIGLIFIHSNDFVRKNSSNQED